MGESATQRGSFFMGTSFFRFIPQWTTKHEGGRISRLSLGIGRDLNRFDISSSSNPGTYYYLSTYTGSFRGELENPMTETWKAILKTDTRLSQTNFGYRFPSGAGGANADAPVQSETTPQSSEVGLYLRNTVKPKVSPWTLSPSVRFDYFDLTREAIFQPRLGIKYHLDDFWELRTSGGLYSQGPKPQDIDENLGNPNLKAERAWHLTVGTERDFRAGKDRGLVFSSDVFYKRMESLVVSSSALVERGGTLYPERYANNATGSAYGIASSLRFEGKPWDVSVSYTLSRSTRNIPTFGETLFAYDQTHILTAVAMMDLGSDWSIGTRLRYTSGNPYTPVVASVFDSDTGIYHPIYGKHFSARHDPFFTLDLRLDKKWVEETYIWSVYLDIQNVTNHQNSDWIVYSYDYKRSGKLSLLPLIPSLGIKGDSDAIDISSFSFFKLRHSV